MKTILLWCILLVLCWPIAVVMLFLFPIIWLVLLPFRVLGITIEAVIKLIGALFMLPFRLVQRI